MHGSFSFVSRLVPLTYIMQNMPSNTAPSFVSVDNSFHRWARGFLRGEGSENSNLSVGAFFSTFLMVGEKGESKFSKNKAVP